MSQQHNYKAFRARFQKRTMVLSIYKESRLLYVPPRRDSLTRRPDLESLLLRTKKVLRIRVEKKISHDDMLLERLKSGTEAVAWLGNQRPWCKK